MALEIGLKGEYSIVVDEKTSASTLGSGGLDVFATPIMIAVMEKASLDCVQPYLDEGCSTVGTLINVAHEAATPMGCTVTAKSELIAIDRRKLTFKVEAYDDTERIGRGVHERFIINEAKFMEKANSKKPAE